MPRRTTSGSLGRLSRGDAQAAVSPGGPISASTASRKRARLAALAQAPGPVRRGAVGRVAQEHQQPRLRDAARHPGRRVGVGEVRGARFAGQDRVQALRDRPAAARLVGREAQAVPGQPVRVAVAVEEVRLARPGQDVGVGVELAQQMRRAAAGGADDDEVRQQVPAPQELAADAAGAARPRCARGRRPGRLGVPCL